VLRLSVHVQSRILERALELAWIEAAIASPDRRAVDPDPTLSHSFKAIAAFGGRVLKPGHRAEGQDVLVVTAHFDRRARR
jgi:hypothetical protein